MENLDEIMKLMIKWNQHSTMQDQGKTTGEGLTESLSSVSHLRECLSRLIFSAFLTLHFHS